jgi:hypothetical protein
MTLKNEETETHNINITYARSTNGTCADCGATVEECFIAPCKYHQTEYTGRTRKVAGRKTKYAMLVYQAGIANVFAVTCLNLSDFGRDAKRLLQADFRTCESFARGMAASGVTVRTAQCNLAGDIISATWSDDLDSAPFSESFHPVHEN